MRAPAKPVWNSLKGAALNSIQIGDVALVYPEGRVKGPEQRYRITWMVRQQVGGEWPIFAAVTGLRVYGHAACQIQHRDDLHARYQARTS
jgi:hypothetical protein